MIKINPWKILSTIIIHQTPWIEIKADTCEVEGKELIYTYTRRRDEGPMIIAEESDGKLWLVQQYRHPIKKIVWQFPAEGKNPDESWESAAVRGIEEELGKTSSDITFIGATHPDPGGLEQLAQIYLASNLVNISSEDMHRDELELLNIKAFSLEEIDQMIESGEICDNWTIAGLFLYQRYKSKL